MYTESTLSPITALRICGIVAAAFAVIACHPPPREDAEPTASPTSIAVGAVETPQAPTAIAAAAATATPVATATATPEPTALPDRTTCETIQGSDYRSEAERQFFLSNCIPTPAPVTPTVEVTSALRPATPTSTPLQNAAVSAEADPVEGWWLLFFDNGGGQNIKFDAQGKAVDFGPRERAPALAGQASIDGTTMTINADGFITDEGTMFSFTYMGTRLSAAEYAGLGLPPAIGSGVAFRGQLKRSDLPTANTVIAVWACRDCPITFIPIQ